MDDDLRLLAGGWRKLPRGKWTHDDLPASQGRRRPFTTAQALTVQNGADVAPDLADLRKDTG